MGILSGAACGERGTVDIPKPPLCAWTLTFFQALSSVDGAAWVSAAKPTAAIERGVPEILTIFVIITVYGFEGVRLEDRGTCWVRTCGGLYTFYIPIMYTHPHP